MTTSEHEVREYEQPAASKEELLARIRAEAAFAPELELEKHAERLAATARPVIVFVDRDEPESAGRSRLGGSPDLPDGFAWPIGPDGRPYAFAGQFDLGELPKVDCELSHALPATGVLCVFVAGDGTGEVPAWSDDFGKMFWFPASTSLQTTTPPPEAHPEEWFPPEVESIGLAFERFVETPRLDEWDGWPGESEADHEVCYYLLAGLALGEYEFHGQFFGYTKEIHAPPESPGPGWEPLLTLYSVEELGWCFLDESALIVFARAEHLREGNFAELRCQPV